MKPNRRWSNEGKTQAEQAQETDDSWEGRGGYAWEECEPEADARGYSFIGLDDNLQEEVRHGRRHCLVIVP